jgi:hypothetical protein
MIEFLCEVSMWLNVEEIKRDVKFNPLLRAWGATVLGRTASGLAIHRNFYPTREEAECATLTDTMVIDRWLIC